MFRCLVSRLPKIANNLLSNVIKQPVRSICNARTPMLLSPFTNCATNASNLNNKCLVKPALMVAPIREFHAKGSKIRYLDFRYKFSTCHFRSHLLIIRKQKMKKHRRRKWRRKYKCLLAKQRLKREISKEKAFRVELLTMIRRAEHFNPKEYALNKINELNNRPRELTRAEKLEELKELIRVNRYQVSYIKPKHKRPETYGLDP